MTTSTALSQVSLSCLSASAVVKAEQQPLYQLNIRGCGEYLVSTDYDESLRGLNAAAAEYSVRRRPQQPFYGDSALRATYEAACTCASEHRAEVVASKHACKATECAPTRLLPVPARNTYSPRKPMGGCQCTSPWAGLNGTMHSPTASSCAACTVI